jgi:hypothetical protein
MATGHEIPPEIDDDYLKRVRRYVDMADRFKKLVVGLAVEDLSDADYLEGDLTDAEVDEDGRLIGGFQLSHGHYEVELSGEPEIDPVLELNATVDLARPEGGRIYNLNTYSLLGQLLEVAYYEDMPLKPGGYHGTEDVLSRFKVARGNAESIGVHFSEAFKIRSLTSNVKAVQESGRLTLLSACNCT